MHVNHRYLIATFKAAVANPNPVVLDFGCGAGELVEGGRRAGFEFFGADVFYDGGSARKTVMEKGLLGQTIREINNGVIPFESARFDAVVANQVFEHVDDIEQVAKEIRRVLKPGGVLISLFPSRESIREGHCGVPWVHRFPPRSRLRFGYMLAFRSMGLGYHKRNVSCRRWSHDFLDWLDKYTHYRSRREVRAVMSQHFDTVEFHEDDYMRFRVRVSKLSSLSLLLRVVGFRELARWISIRFGSTVLVARKSAAAAMETSAAA